MEKQIEEAAKQKYNTETVKGKHWVKTLTEAKYKTFIEGANWALSQKEPIKGVEELQSRIHKIMKSHELIHNNVYFINTFEASVEIAGLITTNNIQSKPVVDKELRDKFYWFIGKEWDGKDDSLFNWFFSNITNTSEGDKGVSADIIKRTDSTNTGYFEFNK